MSDRFDIHLVQALKNNVSEKLDAIRDRMIKYKTKEVPVVDSAGNEFLAIIHKNELIFAKDTEEGLAEVSNEVAYSLAIFLTADQSGPVKEKPAVEYEEEQPVEPVIETTPVVSENTDKAYEKYQKFVELESARDNEEPGTLTREAFEEARRHPMMKSTTGYVDQISSSPCWASIFSPDSDKCDICATVKRCAIEMGYTRQV